MSFGSRDLGTAPKISIRLDTLSNGFEPFVSMHAAINYFAEKDAALKLFFKTGPVWAKNIRDKHLNAC